MEKKEKRSFTNSKRCLLAAVLFFLVTVPFRRLFALTEVTEVRPAGAFPPVFGLLFGGWGALGCALGNLAADILSGYSPRICIWGFPAQFLYGYLPYLLWRCGKKDGRTAICLSNVRHVLKYIGIVFADTLFMAGALGMMLQLLHQGNLLSQSTLLLFFNNLAFSLILGIPMLIVADVIRGGNRRQTLTLTVRFVLLFLLLSVVSAALMGIVSYRELVRSAEDAVTVWNRIYIRVSVDFFVLCGLSVCFLSYLEKNITVPIETLAGIAGSYADREKLKKLKESGRDGELTEKRINSRELVAQCGKLSRIHGEPGDLAEAFRKMMLDVERYVDDITHITREKERIRTELKVASHIQEDMLPDSHTLLSGREEFTLRASMTPAKEVGGDFYDFFLLDEDRLAFLVADVSGKGVPAALFMVVAKTLLQNWTRNSDAADQVFSHTNRDLCRENKNGMFVTAWMGVLTLSTGRLVFVNAGHTRPLLKRKDGEYFFPEERCGFVLAGMEDTRYVQEELWMKPGDALFLYTDGVTEANDAKGGLYGEKRLKEALNRRPDSPPEETLKAVWEDVAQFQGEAEQFDDITMLCVRYNGNGFRELTGPADMARMPEVMEFVDGILKEEGVGGMTCEIVRAAVDEIFSNICRHSGAKETTVGVRVTQNNDGRLMARLFFEDDGTPFDPLARPDPDVRARMEERREGGLGIYLVKKQMDEIFYELVNGKNRLTAGKSDNARADKKAVRYEVP